jgi:hypothetical protein
MFTPVNPFIKKNTAQPVFGSHSEPMPAAVSMASVNQTLSQLRPILQRDQFESKPMRFGASAAPGGNDPNRNNFFNRHLDDPGDGNISDDWDPVTNTFKPSASSVISKAEAAAIDKALRQEADDRGILVNQLRRTTAKIYYLDPNTKQLKMLSASRAFVISRPPKLLPLDEINLRRQALVDALNEAQAKEEKSRRNLKGDITFVDPITRISEIIKPQTLRARLTRLNNQVKRHAKMAQAVNDASAEFDSTAYASGSQPANAPIGGQNYTAHDTEQWLVVNAVEHFRNTGTLPPGTSEITARSLLSEMREEHAQRMASHPVRFDRTYYDPARNAYVAKNIYENNQTIDDVRAAEISRLDQLINYYWPKHRRKHS